MQTAYATLDAAIANSRLSPAEIAKTRGAAKQFEGMFVSEMLNHMFEGVKADPTFGGGQAEDMFHSLLVNEYGKKMTEGPRSLGIADQLQKMMIEMQQ